MGKLLRAAYRFLDAGFVLETDSLAFLDHFDRAYARFRAAEDPAAPLYRVMLNGDPRAIIAGQTTHATSADALRQYAHGAILKAVMARVQDHFLFHAAALCTNGDQGQILAGDAGLGKTTLTLALIRRGFRFLSDDVTAVGQADGRLDPFPRRLGFRSPAGLPGEKSLVDAEELVPGSLATPSNCPPRFLFVLTATNGQHNASIGYLVLDHIPNGLLAAIRDCAGVRHAEAMRRQPYPVVRLELAPEALPIVVLHEIEGVCQRHDTLLFEFLRGYGNAPDFRGRPELLSLTASEAALELLRHYRNGPNAALLRQRFGGSVVRLYLHLAGLAAGMACFRLTVGRLTDMIEIIVKAAEAVQEDSG